MSATLLTRTTRPATPLINEMDQGIEHPRASYKRHQIFISAGLAIGLLLAAIVFELLSVSGTLVVDSSEVEVGEADRAGLAQGERMITLSTVGYAGIDYNEIR